MMLYALGREGERGGKTSQSDYPSLKLLTVFRIRVIMETSLLIVGLDNVAGLGYSSTHWQLIYSLQVFHSRELLVNEACFQRSERKHFLHQCLSVILLTSSLQIIPAIGESSFSGNSNTCNGSSVFQPIHFHSEVILQKKEPNNGKQVDQDESEDCCQNNGAAIAGDTFYDIEQGLFSVHQIKKLKK